jgi:CDP-glucose 4,6-dehydratase
MNELNLRKFEGKKVLVTGHTGFKGSWLSKVLVDSGAHVTGFALAPSTKLSHFEQLNLEGKLEHVVGDIRDFDHLKSVFEATQPEFVFHLAAQALVRPSYHDPRETFSTNVMGSVNILEATRLTPSVRALVYITSDKAYENVEWLWGYRENDVLGGRDPYSGSKGAAEIVFSSYLRSFFDDANNLGAASTRAGNVIGGGDWAVDRIIPDAIRALQAGNSLQIRNPEATRPWQHVLEPVSGYLQLALALREEPKEYSGSWNFGPPAGNVRSVIDVASALYAHIGQGSVSILSDASKVHEANLLQLNCDKANQLLDWNAKWTADEAVVRTAEWYRSLLDGKDMEAVTSHQISAYFGGSND